MIKRTFCSFGALAAVVAASPAFAHVGPSAEHAFTGGLLHPLTGLDHLLAMVAVGFWAAMIGVRAIALVPAAFLVALLAGFGLGLAGVPLPMIEPGILASIIVLGLMIAAAFRPPVALGALLVAGFGLFHGFAHGSEVAGGSPALFGMGFAASSVGLLGTGLALGLLLAETRMPGRIAGRVLGGLLALSGFVLAFGT